MEATLSRREGVVVGFFWIVVVAVGLLVAYQAVTGGASRQERAAHAEAQTEVLEKKIANLEAAARANPNNLQGLVTLGDAYLDSRRGQDALRVFLQAETIAPDDVHVLSDLGTIYQQSGRVDEALAKFGRIVELDPSQVSARVHLGLLYQSTGNAQKALETFKAALALNPEPRYAEMIRSQITKLESEHGK
ncbi:MAG: tetratricopeptide repeat protein [Thermodesulfobacteriota bacterium]